MNGIEPLAIVRAVQIAASVALAGAFAFRRLVLSRSPHGPGAAGGAIAVVERWLLAWCGATLVIAVVSWLAWLVLTASGMSGLPLHRALDADVLGIVLSRTTFGQVWTVRLACMLALAACLIVARRSARQSAERTHAIAATCALALLGALAGTGHAVGGAPSERLMHVGIDVLHLLGAGAWLGALVPLLFVLGRARATSEPAWHALAAQATRRFSALGLFSVLLLLVSGVLNAAWLVGGWTALGTTPYGHLVAAKIVLFALVVAIAAVNRLVLTPRLTTPAVAPGAVQALRRNVVAELVIGATIVVVVGVLGVTPPSAHEHMGGRQGMQAE